MLTIWTDKIKHSTAGSSFRVTFSVAPNELEYLNKLYDCFSSMNWSSFPITADRNDENSSEKPNNCETCRNKGFEGCEQPCLGCGCCGLYEPKDEPTISKMEQVEDNDYWEQLFIKVVRGDTCDYCKHRDVEGRDYPCLECKGYDLYESKDEPQTDCAWR